MTQPTTKNIWSCPKCGADNHVPDTMTNDSTWEQHAHGVLMPAILVCRKCAVAVTPSEILVTGKH